MSPKMSGDFELSSQYEALAKKARQNAVGQLAAGTVLSAISRRAGVGSTTSRRPVQTVAATQNFKGKTMLLIGDTKFGHTEVLKDGKIYSVNPGEKFKAPKTQGDNLKNGIYVELPPGTTIDEAQLIGRQVSCAGGACRITGINSKGKVPGTPSDLARQVIEGQIGTNVFQVGPKTLGQIASNSDRNLSLLGAAPTIVVLASDGIGEVVTIMKGEGSDPDSQDDSE